MIYGKATKDFAIAENKKKRGGKVSVSNVFTYVKELFYNRNSKKNEPFVSAMQLVLRYRLFYRT